MPVLTPRELCIVIGETPGKPSEIFSATKKLDALQRKLTNKRHIDAIDALIPLAEEEAIKAEKKGSSFDVEFHRNMKILARRKGLRN